MPQQLPSPSETYDQIMRNREGVQQQQQLNAALDTAPIDPDRAARIFYVQGKTALPSEVIDADLDNLYEQVKRNEFNYNNYTDQLNGAPAFNKWVASDPYHPAVVERDRRHLTRIERMFDSIHRGWNRGDAMFELSRISNRRRAGDQREGDDEILEDLRQLVEADDFGLDSFWAQVLVETGAQANIQLEILQESMGSAVSGAGIGATVAAPFGVGILAGAATGFGVGWRVGAFESGRKLEQGLAYDEYIQLGASEANARAISAYVGAANGALEMIGLNAMVKFIPGAKRIQGKAGKYLVERMFKKPTVAGAHRLLAARYGEVMGTEIFTEIMQESITMAGAEYLKRQMRETGDLRPETAPMTFDQWVDSLAEIAVKTVQGTLLLGGIGPGASYIGDIRRARNAKATGVYIKSVGEGAQDAEMKKDPRLAPKFKEYFQKLAEKGPVKEVRFDMDAWIDYWEAQGQDVAQVSQALGVNLEEVWAQGGDVVIDLETFGDKLAHTDHFNKELWKDAKLQSDTMSYREATEFLADPEEHVNRLKEDLKETFGVEVSDDFDNIVKDVTGQLMQAGKFDQKAAEQQARLMAAVFTTQALRNPNANVTPWQLYTQRLYGIRMDVRETALARGAVDLSIDPLLDSIRAGDIPTQRQIFGDSLVDFVVKAGGLVDDGGELSARDYKKLRRGLVRDDGDTLDGMAERAYESGYIAARDPNLLLEMMDRELQGEEPVFSAQMADQGLQTRAADLNDLASYLESEGIDVEKMTNQEIREAMNRRQVFEQTDDKTLEELGELILATIGNPRASESYAADLIRIEGMLPRVAEEQDFGDLEFTDRVRMSGREGIRTRKAQKVYETEVKKRNALKKLMDCMSATR